MNEERWKKLNEIFHQALELPENERDDFVEKNCADDTELKTEVLKMLESAESGTDFLNENIIGSFENLLPVAVDLKGKKIGQYRIIREIGRGGMGAVFLAERADEEFEQKVALKIVHQQFANKNLLERFKTERRILASLKHPNIAHLIDGGTTDDGLPYFVMEYVEGETLLEYCDKNELTTNERLKIFQRICSAVSHAHKNLIIHRDIKPTNILVTKDGIPKLLDFGIAKPFSDDFATLTQTGARMLTPDYASPEQVSGEIVTTSTDVYSLGVVLYELLTGHRPYKLNPNSPLEALRLICEEEPHLPSSIASNETRGNSAQQTNPTSKVHNPKSLQGDIDNILLKSLRKEPERRYATVNEFSQDIQRHLDGLPVNARANTFSYRADKFIKRNRAAVIAAAVVLISILGALTISIRQTVIAQRERAKAEQRFNDVRKLANSVVFEFHDSIQNLPGSTPTRELLVTRALEYLDKLASEDSTDPTLLLELADAYEKIGDIQGGMFTSNLGKRDLAFESFEKSLRIRESLVNQNPADTEFKRKLADSYLKLGNMLWIQAKISESVEMYRKSLDIHEKFYAENPNDKNIVIQLAVVLTRYGFVVAANGKADEGLESSQRAVELLENLNKQAPEDKDVLDKLSMSYDSHVNILEKMKSDFPKALQIQQKSEEISRKLYLDEPQNTSLKRGYAVSLFKVAEILEDLNQNQKALEKSSEGLKVINELAEADLQNEDFQQTAAAFETQYGGLLVKTGKAAEALAMLEKAKNTLERLQSKSPNDEVVHFRIATVQNNLGKAHFAIGSKNKDKNAVRIARENFQKGREVYKNFRDAGKLFGLDAAKVDEMAESIKKCDEILSAG